MTKPLNVTIVILGYADSLFDIDLLKKHQSSFFKIDNICIKRILPDPQIHDGRLDIIYSTDDIAKLLKDVTGDVVVSYGKFITAIINFLIMAFVVFMLVKAINNMKKEEPKAAPTTKKCPFCKTDIPLEATKCPHCTSKLEQE